MAPSTHHGPQEAALDAKHELLAKENELQVIEQDAVPKVDCPESASHTHSTRGCVSSS